jgi:cystathionine beta-lyase/cystathionine gamma-synthase
MRDYEGKFAPGSMIFFSLKGKSPTNRRNRGEKVINYLADNAYTITLAVSLGHIRTLVEHPSSLTHSAIPLKEQIEKGMDPGGIRLSIGLEPAKDIIADLLEAIEQV